MRVRGGGLGVRVLFRGLGVWGFGVRVSRPYALQLRGLVHAQRVLGGWLGFRVGG